MNAKSDTSNIYHYTCTYITGADLGICERGGGGILGEGFGVFPRPPAVL